MSHPTPSRPSPSRPAPSRPKQARSHQPPIARPQRPSQASIGFLMIWHGVFSGGFFVAMLTGKGAYDAHVFAGVVVIFAIGIRLLVGTVFPGTHVLSFPVPDPTTLIKGAHGVRRFISHTMGLVMLAMCAAAALTGWYSRTDADLHGAISYLALALIGGHVVLVILMQGWKRLESAVQAKP